MKIRAIFITMLPCQSKCKFHFDKKLLYIENYQYKHNSTGYNIKSLTKKKSQILKSSSLYLVELNLKKKKKVLDTFFFLMY